MISEKQMRAIYVTSDLLATALAWFVFSYIRFTSLPKEIPIAGFSQFLSIRTVSIGQMVFPLGMLGIYWISGFYNKVYIKSRIDDFTATLTTAAIGSILIYFAAIVDDPIPDRATNYELLATLFGLLFSFVFVERLIINTINTNAIKHGKISFNALVVCNPEQALEIKHRMETGVNHMSHAYRIVGIVPLHTSAEKETENTNAIRRAGIPIIPIDEVERHIDPLGIKAVVLAAPHESPRNLLPIINRLLPLEIPVMVSLSVFSLLTTKPRLSRVAADPLIDISSPDISGCTANLKRAGDILASSIAIVLLLPVYAAIAIAVKIDSKGPVIYAQTRIGRRRKPFRILKFRTMVPDSEPNGPCLSQQNDPRITRVGRFLRKYRLDELPQFFNVIAGHMSLVGPRPEREYYIRKIMEVAPYYTLLHCVRPGLTSLGMVKHGYASTVEEMVQRMHYDLIYIENVSFSTDLKIIVYTVSTVISGKGL